MTAVGRPSDTHNGTVQHDWVAVAADPTSVATGLEKLCRYVLRPELSKDRVSVLPDGRVRYALTRAWSNGVIDFVFTPEALVERVAALVPPPRANTVLYHGVLASRARDRQRLLPRPAPKRAFEVDALPCPRCGEAMTLRTVVVRPPATLKVPSGLRASAPGPP